MPVVGSGGDHRSVVELSAGEPIRRVAVHVLPRARCGSMGKINGKTQRRKPRPDSSYWSSLSAFFVVHNMNESGQHGKTERNSRTICPRGPSSRPCGRPVSASPGVFVASILVWPFRRPRTSLNYCSDPGVLRVEKCIGARVARPDRAFRYRPDKRRKKYTARTPRLDHVGPERHHGHRIANHWKAKQPQHTRPNNRPRSRPCSAARRSAGRCRGPPARAAAGDRPTFRVEASARQRDAVDRHLVFEAPKSSTTPSKSAKRTLVATPSCFVDAVRRQSRAAGSSCRPGWRTRKPQTVNRNYYGARASPSSC